MALLPRDPKSRSTVRNLFAGSAAVAAGIGATIAGPEGALALRGLEAVLVSSVVVGAQQFAAYLTSYNANADFSEAAEALPPADLLLANHDLSAAIGEALRVCLEQASKEPSLIEGLSPNNVKRRHASLESVADRAVEFWKTQAKPPKGLRERDTARVFLVAWDLGGGADPDDPEAQILSTDEWSKIGVGLYEMAYPQPAGRKDPEFVEVAFQSKLARYLNRQFPYTLREVFKGGGGQHERFAALQIHIWTQLLAQNRVALNYLESIDADTKKIEKEIRRCGDNLTKAIEDLGERTERQNEAVLDGLASCVARIDDSISASLTTTRKELQSLRDRLKPWMDSLESFEGKYWKKQFRDPALRHLEGREQLVRSILIGRENDIACAADFLRRPSAAEVLVVHARPGSGKTRLALEMGRNATRAGWNVQFLNKLDIPERLREVVEPFRGTKEPVLLIWDDLQPGHDKIVSQFVEMHESLDSGDFPPIKRVVTCWQIMLPTFRKIGADDENHPYVELLSLEPIPETSVEEWAELLQSAFGVPEESARGLLAIHGANPLILLMGAYEGFSTGEMAGLASRGGLLKLAYRQFLGRLSEEAEASGLTPGPIEGFRALAAIGSWQFRDEDSDEALAYEETFRWLANREFVEREAKARRYSIPFDLLRSVIVAESFADENGPFSLDDPSRRWATASQDFWPLRFAEVYILTSSMLEVEHRIVALEDLSTCALNSIGNPTVSEEMDWSLALLEVTNSESDPRICRIFARAIGAMRRDDDSEQAGAIDFLWAAALYNSLAGDPDPASCYAIAEQIQEVSSRYEPGDSPVDSFLSGAVMLALSRRLDFVPLNEIFYEWNRLVKLAKAEFERGEFVGDGAVALMRHIENHSAQLSELTEASDRFWPETATEENEASAAESTDSAKAGKEASFPCADHDDSA